VRQLDPEAPVDVANEARAVEAAGARAAPPVRDAEEPLRVRNRLLADRRLLRRHQGEPLPSLHAETDGLALRRRGTAGERRAGLDDEGATEDEREQKQSERGGHEENPFGVGRRRKARRVVVGQAAGKQRRFRPSMGPTGRER
jgi:hypothetical protein